MIGRLSYVTSLDKRERYWRQYKRVTNGNSPNNEGWIARRHYLPPSPKGYQWAPGEPVVLVAWSTAGWLATATEGALEAIVKANGRSKAKVQWQRRGISAIVALNRIRPLWLVRGSAP